MYIHTIYTYMDTILYIRIYIYIYIYIATSREARPTPDLKTVYKRHWFLTKTMFWQGRTSDSKVLPRR